MQPKEAGCAQFFDAHETLSPAHSLSRQKGGYDPICLMIPCHRVVGVKGHLPGYAAGLDRKAYLLELERRTSLPDPKYACP